MAVASVTDFKQSLRTLRKSPAFLISALLTIALSIALNLAVFALIDAIFLRKLPVPEPDRLSYLMFGSPEQRLRFDGPLFDAVVKRQSAFTELFAWNSYPFDLTENDETRRHQGVFLTGNAFKVLGVRATAGRLLTDADDGGSGADGPVVVISARLWRERYQQDSSVIGRTVTLNGKAATIVGVAPTGFEGIVVGEGPDFYATFEFEKLVRGPSAIRHASGNFGLLVGARLKAGTGLSQAAADMRRIESESMDEAVPPPVRHENFVQAMHIAVQPGHTGWSSLRTLYQRALFLAQALCVLVFLGCCANVAILQMARGAARQNELALRSALGAGKRQLLLLLGQESALLVLGGASIGLLLSIPAARFMIEFLQARNPGLFLDVQPNLMSTVALGGLMLVCVLLVGFLPALRVLRPRQTLDLRTSGRVVQADAGPSRGQWLMIVQVAVTVVIIMNAGLLSSSLLKILNVPAGFQSNGLILAPTDLERIPEKNEQLADLFRRMIQRMDEQPGVSVASVVSAPPFQDITSIADVVAIDGTSSPREDKRVSVYVVGPRYFETLGTTLSMGRDFNMDDTRNATRSCIVNQAAADFFFSGRGALRQFVRTADPRQFPVPITCEIVGVVNNSRYSSFRRAAERTLYIPFNGFMQRPMMYMQLAIRSPDPAFSTAAYRKVMHEFAPSAPVYTPVTTDTLMRNGLSNERMLTSLAQLLAAFALIVTALGLGGIVSGNVTNRTQEIGIRVALGASRNSILWLLTRRALILSGIGIAIGLPLSLGVARLLTSFLYEAGTLDLSMFLALLLTFAIVLLASWIPARRALSLDPISAIRS